MPGYYPVMLDLRGRPVIVVGGNDAAAEKAASLSRSGARVVVLAPSFTDELEAMASRGEVELWRKTYESGDLAGAALVVAAVTYEPEMVEAVWAETQRSGQLVNIVDVPSRCTFIVPSVLRRDQLTIAVSTEGSNPSLAKRVRQRLEDLFPTAFGPYLRLGAVARAHLRRTGVSYARRDRFFGAYEDSEALALLTEGDDAAAREATTTLLHAYGVSVQPDELAACLQRCNGACGATGICLRLRDEARETATA